MDNNKHIQTPAAEQKPDEALFDQAMGEELTDEQLLEMAEGSCSWGANCNRGC